MLGDGLYSGEGQGYKVHLRIDRSGAGGRIAPTISFDLFQNNFFKGTFRTTGANNIHEENGVLRVDASKLTPPHETASLLLSKSAGGNSLIEVSFPSDSSGPISLPVVTPPRMGVMRLVAFEFDRSQILSAPDPVETISDSRQVSVQSCLLESGIEMQIGPNPFEIVAGSESWSRAEIHNAIYNVDSEGRIFNSGLPPLDSRAFRCYVLYLTSYSDDDGVVGVMPDPKRRGTAIFLKTIADYLPDGRARALLSTFAALHEIGHLFNLPHSFEPLSPIFDQGHSALSFMNYPSEYSGNHLASEAANGFPHIEERRFFSRFDFRFTPEELMELRHGNYETIVMGGQNYRGSLDGLRIPSTWSDQEYPQGVGLKLRVRRGNATEINEQKKGTNEENLEKIELFEFGEPVHLELKVTTTKVDGLPIQDCFHLNSDRIQVYIRRPNGSVVEFVPPLIYSRIPKQKWISPSRGYYLNLDLAVSKDGFMFLDPGLYTVRVFTSYQGSPLVSNECTLYIRYPDRQTEDAVVPTLTSDVATYLSIGGGLHLSSAINQLETLSERLPSHPLVNYYRAYRALTEIHGFRQLEFANGRVHTRNIAPEVNLEEPNHILSGDYRKKKGRARKEIATKPSLPFSNLFLGYLGRKLWTWLKKVDEGKADQFRESLVEKLVGDRKINPQLLQAT